MKEIIYLISTLNCSLVFSSSLSLSTFYRANLYKNTFSLAVKYSSKLDIISLAYAYSEINLEDTFARCEIFK